MCRSKCQICLCVCRNSLPQRPRIRFSGRYYVSEPGVSKTLGMCVLCVCVCVYLAALAGNAAVVVTRGLVTTHHTWLILFEVAGNVP